jgi:PadR family transcriptional regulator, regulatory protein PadR
MPGPSPRFLYRLRRELRHGLLPVWILEALSEGPTYGYALLGRLRGRAGSERALGPSAIYPALARLKSFGLVTSYHGTESRGPVRKYYALTPQGRATLPEVQVLASGLLAIPETPRPTPGRRFPLGGEA